jgi:hypothetical protein
MSSRQVPEWHLGAQKNTSWLNHENKLINVFYSWKYYMVLENRVLMGIFRPNR